MGRKYIFTNKRESKKGILSSILGTIALVSIILALYSTFQAQGLALVKYGMAVLFSLLFSLAGLVLGIWSKVEQDHFYVFSYLGIVLNLLAVSGIGLILYAGVYGS